MKTNTMIKRDETNLTEIFRPGPVSSGFHVFSALRRQVPLLLDRLVDFLILESATAHSSRTANFSYEIGKLMWIDSGNVFDPYHMAQSAVKKGLDPKRALRALQVARPFTAFQFQQMLDRVPEPVSFSSKDPYQHAWKVPLVILSDLTSLFYDPEIQEKDVRRAFREFMMRLYFLKKRAVVVALQMPYVTPDHRHDFLPQLLGMATTVSPMLDLPERERVDQMSRDLFQRAPAAHANAVADR